MPEKHFAWYPTHDKWVIIILVPNKVRLEGQVVV